MVRRYVQHSFEGKGSLGEMFWGHQPADVASTIPVRTALVNLSNGD